MRKGAVMITQTMLSEEITGLTTIPPNYVTIIFFFDGAVNRIFLN